jgi:hypothetical protein
LSEEHLKDLVDAKIDQVVEAAAHYLNQRHPRLNVRAGLSGTGQLFVGNGLTLSIAGERVTISGSRNARTERSMDELSQEASTFVRLVADRLFAQEIGLALKARATLLSGQTADVTNAGVVQRATVYSVQINDLKARVFVLPQARVQIFIDNGTFAQARTATQQLIKGIQTQGLQLQMTSDIEQHRDDVDHVHVHPTLKGGNE